ncbi:maleylacetoacetate isomerase [Novosphingobium sp. ZN18A2]|uniref:maleylacetoacetate isomerase n=1 Tax=Novosphingobium sp. ZN18A2 TaxID=3079861 RepID=UPI0030CB4AAD
MIRLHGYWRSTASYRVRIALNLKGVDYDQVTHDLRTGEQAADDYREIAPQGLVPALETDGGIFTQSTAIMEWLDEVFPDPPLLPADPPGRAQVRAMVALVACDIHPLNNLRVLQSLRRDLHAGDRAVNEWIARWIGEGFAALEQQVARRGDGFCFGDAPTLADCCLVPQVFGAERFDVNMAPYPRLREITARCRDLPAFADAHPARQPDADPVA